MANSGTIIINNNAQSSTLFIGVDRQLNGRLSSADLTIKPGESGTIDVASGLHTIDALFYTGIPGGGVQISGEPEKEVTVGACEEANVFFNK